MKPTKYVKVWIVQGNYGQGWEDECAEDTYREGREQVKCYRENSPYPSRLICRRVLRANYETGNF